MVVSDCGSSISISVARRNLVAARLHVLTGSCRSASNRHGTSTRKSQKYRRQSNYRERQSRADILHYAHGSGRCTTAPAAPIARAPATTKCPAKRPRSSGSVGICAARLPCSVYAPEDNDAGGKQLIFQQFILASSQSILRRRGTRGAGLGARDNACTDVPCHLAQKMRPTATGRSPRPE
jgi:hypothetical protein